MPSSWSVLNRISLMEICLGWHMSHVFWGVPHWVVSTSIDHGNSVIFFERCHAPSELFKEKFREPGGWCQPLSGRFPPAEAKEVKPGTTCLPPNSGLSNDSIWNWTSKLRYNLLTCSIDMPGDTYYTNRTTDLKDTREKKDLNQPQYFARYLSHPVTSHWVAPLFPQGSGSMMTKTTSQLNFHPHSVLHALWSSGSKL